MPRVPRLPPGAFIHAVCIVHDKKPWTEVRGHRVGEPNRYRDSRPTVFTAITR